MDTPEVSAGKSMPKPTIMAMLPVHNVEFYRGHAAGLKLDSDRLVRGYLLQTIVSDDRNIFFTLINDFPPLTADQSLQAGMDLNARFALEINASELPQDIRAKLAQVREDIKPLDLGQWEDFKSAYGIWEKTRQVIEEKINASPELTADVNYSIQVVPELDDLMRETQSPK
ncbi:hypothetical protein HYU94_01095 [Candidatus Daviesbacteria bacterium]|nr:hypothetical protein [Candidatus Daviesbacteria bacterium]